MDTVIERNNTSLTAIGLPTYISSAKAHSVTGKEAGAATIETSTSVAEGGDDSVVEQPTADKLTSGMRFKDDSNYEYILGVNADDQWVVTTDTGTYVLNYEEDTDTYFIQGTTGRYNLKFIGG